MKMIAEAICWFFTFHNYELLDTWHKFTDDDLVKVKDYRCKNCGKIIHREEE